tara:strand:+ start:438 stop:2102 length:1665 start_codon:yes stop_codon:yes gene_type:complete
MSDLNQDLINKFIKFLSQKQYKRLKFEIDLLGDIESQHPIIIFYYASAIALDHSSKNEELSSAADLFEKIYLLKKDLQSLYNMIAISFKTKIFNRVLPYILKEYKKNEKDLNLLEGLAKINLFMGNNLESIKFFGKLFELDPKRKDYRLSYIGTFNYVSNYDQTEYLKISKKYTQVYEKNSISEKFDHKFINDKIKIGFLSGNLKAHPVSFFLKGLIENIDKAKFDLIFFSNLKISEQDSYSDFFKKSSSQWYDVLDLEDDFLTKKIRKLNIDILIDLNGFFEGNRFQIFVDRCAKFQIVWLGYNNSLGINNIDFIIADSNLFKKGEEHLYSERILLFNKIWNSMSLPENLPNISKDKNKNLFSYGSFNNYTKLSNETIEVWSKIINHSNSRLFLKSSMPVTEDIKNNILRKFFSNGVKKNQIIFLDRTEKIIDHYESYNKINVALDTFPYPGVTTSFEAALMGVPVLTMKGNNINSRCGESIIKNLNLPELIASDKDDYFKKAIDLQKSENLNKLFGHKLRDKALASPLFDTKSFTKEFEKNMISLMSSCIKK